MPFLQLRDSRYPLRGGVNRVGWGAVEVRLPEGAARGGEGVCATIEVAAGGASVSGTSPGTVRLNGMAVLEPVPVLHGDRLEIAGWDLCFGDEAQLGETTVLDVDPDAPIATPSPAAATSKSGGRLVSQTDGREYPVGPEGLVLGRDPTCHVVVGRPDVSRRHLAIRQTAEGYLLLDSSTNGVMVNGGRVMVEVPLGRGDTIRVGHEEFRFHADRASAGEPMAVPQLAATGTFAAARRPDAASAGASTAGRGLLLGTLEVVNEGPLKGTRYELRSPRIDIGRGAHNDVVIADESVSESHAKLQNRDGGWYVADLGSTNGTYVGGTRIHEDTVVQDGSEVRFGGMKFRFRPQGPAARPSGETRVIVGVKGPDPKRAADRLKELAEHASPVKESPAASRAGAATRWLIILVLIAVALWVLSHAGNP